MLIKSISVKNFRCICDATLPCEKLTAILGRNGSGKSTILHALVMFYDTKAAVTPDDFYDDPQTTAIAITVVYSDLNAEEQAEFAPYLQGSELSVTKRITLANGKVDQRYYAATRQVPLLAEISKLRTVTEKRTAWNNLVDSQAMPGLTQKLGGRDNPDTAVSDFTQAHPELTEWVEREEQFFGPKNVGGGKLDKYTKFVYVPAVRDVASDIADKRGTILSELLEMIVMRRFLARPEVKQFRVDFQTRMQDIYNDGNLQEFSELADSISARLRVLVPNSALALKPSLPVLPEIPVPVPLPTLTEDDYAGAIDRKGHGLQRALIFSLLQYLAQARPPTVDESAIAPVEASTVQTIVPAINGKDQPLPLPSTTHTAAASNSASDSASDSAEYLGPDLVIAIEEPELYQHPLRARHLSKVLLSMTERVSPENGRNQVLYSTHSPHFVDVHRFEQLRIARKCKSGSGAAPYSQYRHYTIDEACGELSRISQLPRDSFTARSFRARTHPVMTNIVNEGFFADVVVIVEGQTETAALLTLAEYMQMDWTAKGIAVIAADGKNNIDRPVVIFRGFGIPTYFVFDGDKTVGAKSEATKGDNRRLLRLANVDPQDYPMTGAYASYACFEDDFETYCRSVLGHEQYQELTGRIITHHGLPAKKAMKNFNAVCDFVQQVYEGGSQLPILEDIVEHVTRLADGT